MLSGAPPTAPTSICELIHFRPLLRAHTDPALGHCSYLNTCYSEPTYAQSPSMPPFPQPNTRGPSSLPSGLGAGGRGKDKAPCRYLHYEVDWDGSDGDWAHSNNGKGKDAASQPPHKLGIGMGPAGREMKVVCVCNECCSGLLMSRSSRRNGSTATCADSTTLCWASSTLSWQTRHGIST
jgi:mRNA (2'-O-methyladenosine-N6-)-methyltransferase